MERQVFLLVKELVSNVVRHADAEHAGIAIEIGDSEIAVEVRDDGSGFERAEVAETSLGLRSMEDRVAALGGSMLVETGPKAGTAVRIGLPLTAST
jgi:signal transduction histidine kinase